MHDDSLLITIRWRIRCFLTVYTVTSNTIWALKRRRVERVDWRSVCVELRRVINAVILERRKKNIPLCIYRARSILNYNLSISSVTV